MLSRLKGIETRSDCRQRCWPWYRLWICFPVWRELKQALEDHYSLRKSSTLDMLSRLKGIETSGKLLDGTGIRRLWICFPVWRELKPRFCGYFVNEVDDRTLDMLSRLKGIETLSNFFCHHSCDRYFGYAFPFEGNWNFFIAATNSSLSIALDMLSRLKGIETSSILLLSSLSLSLWICFPVWRELKLKTTTRLFRSRYPLDMVSRLKGIETLGSNSWIFSSISLWIWFPVWRELKLLF